MLSIDRHADILLIARIGTIVACADMWLNYQIGHDRYNTRHCVIPCIAAHIAIAIGRAIIDKLSKRFDILSVLVRHRYGTSLACDRWHASCMQSRFHLLITFLSFLFLFT